jgi:hypothetical protein
MTNFSFLKMSQLRYRSGLNHHIGTAAVACPSAAMQVQATAVLPVADPPAANTASRFFATHRRHVSGLRPVRSSQVVVASPKLSKPS